MKYFEAIFHIEPNNETARDILAALAADAGFESFVETDGGLKGYAQQAVFDRAALDDFLSDFPLPDTTVSYTLAEAEDKDWNAAWEADGFTPIVIGTDCVVRSAADTSVCTAKYDIRINPRLAFGTGHHQTTQMLLQQLLADDLAGKTVADAGCGTGILSIMAALRGAKHVFAYDIDEWSVENTQQNARLNGVTCISVQQGDASALDAAGTFDVLLANINRNILLADMPRFARVLNPAATLYLSGFYTTDIPALTDEAARFGLHVVQQHEKEGWACLKLLLRS